MNDATTDARIGFEVFAVGMSGEIRSLVKSNADVPLSGAVTVGTVSLSDLAEDEFLFFRWADANGRPLGENDFFPRAYKYYDLPSANVTSRWTEDDGKPVLVLSADKPAFFVTATADVAGYFSDNAVTLLPGEERRLTFTPRNGTELSAPQESLVVRHLAQTYERTE